MSVGTHLTETASKLILSDAEKSNINRSVLAIGGKLDICFGNQINRHFKFGSFTRNTILPRRIDSCSDVDYMVTFNTSDEEYTPPDVSE